MRPISIIKHTVEAIFNTIREYIDASDATEALLDFVE